MPKIKYGFVSNLISTSALDGQLNSCSATPSFPRPRTSVRGKSAHPKGRHSKHACSAAEQVIWNPAFSQRVQLVAAEAGFQIAHCAALRIAFGMTVLLCFSFLRLFFTISHLTRKISLGFRTTTFSPDTRAQTRESRLSTVSLVGSLDSFFPLSWE